MSNFSATREESSGEVKVTLKGQIDEDATFSNLDLTNASSVVLELESVQTINSCGIREWIKWIRTAPPSAKIVYKKCPKVIIDQINMVSGFLPETGRVESFYVPYFCENSGNEKMVLFTEGKEFKNGEVHPPTDVKDDTGEVMEMDVIESKYFKFLKK